MLETCYPTVGGDFAGVGFFCILHLPGSIELKCLTTVRDVDLVARNSGGEQGFVE
jgi:hypothetical protein